MKSLIPFSIAQRLGVVGALLCLLNAALAADEPWSQFRGARGRARHSDGVAVELVRDQKCHVEDGDS